ncbi:TPA: hypothetical protein ACKP7T_000064 [Pseudomonas aeruginosa]|nr:hypothetical protein [Pseudomonas aeruginosa]HEJ5550241.1 hypothetical protein [Pseudomonas aeruginosa]HEJ5802072.1 hypothetical protein [Pseudomonas aeruginosa]
MSHDLLIPDALLSPLRLDTSVDAGGSPVLVAAPNGGAVSFEQYDQLLTLCVEMSRLLSEPDGFSRRMHEHMVSGDTKGAAAQVFAQAFSSQFKGTGAVNYIEAHFESRDPEVGPLVVTLQRRHGMTAGQLRARAELAASSLQGLLQEMLDLDHWLDEEIAPADLIARCKVATSEPLVISQPLAQALVERIRQIEGEGFTLQGDLQYHHGELAAAAASYLLDSHRQALLDDVSGVPATPPQAWPFNSAWWKPADQQRNVEKALGLGLAELERLAGLQQGSSSSHGTDKE